MAKPTDKQLADRGVADHLKAGAKNIKTTYNTLYNRPGPGGGAGTVPMNLKIAAIGKTGKNMPKAPAATRAKVVGMGALSVTPLGPVAAAVSGVVKSVQAKSQAKANLAAAKNPAPAKSAPTLNIKAPTKPAAPAAKVGVKPAAPAPATGPKIGQRKL